MDDKIQNTLEDLRKNTSKRLPRVIKKTEYHTVVYQPENRERLSKNFKSSGNIDDS